MNKTTRILAAAVLGLGASAVSASDFPQGPIEVTVPFAAGGGLTRTPARSPRPSPRR
ncbi:hypothetical protein H0I39_20895 [Ottowia beijingensis]|uniref:Tripartite tricarboxylate transporter family receptor n=1 Tax=Ottowia beijingensis TaxID=1207057 RepID=A0A853J039_9BURK|nr:hypothetical protein [Ottowia beijingensis]